MRRTPRIGQLAAGTVAMCVVLSGASSPLMSPAWGLDESTASVCFIAGFGFRGTTGADVFQGSFLPEVAQGGGGADSLSGEGGDDRLCGEEGNDGLEGGHGNDRLYGQQGNDTIRGRAGSDRISGGSGHDRLFGGFFVLFATANDNIYGGPGNDWIETGVQAGHISGGPGDDRIGLWGDQQTVYCGTGDDVVWRYKGPSSAKTLVGCEHTQLQRPPGG